jgi:hypothetical protein
MTLLFAYFANPSAPKNGYPIKIDGTTIRLATKRMLNTFMDSLPIS